MALHEDCKRVHEIYAMAKRPPLEAQTPAEARDGMLRARPVFQPDAPDVAEVRALTAPGPAGPIPLRLYRPIGALSGTALPVLVFYHGGGWVIGDLESHDTLCRQLCNASGICVIAVAYRLAPEHRFPAAVDDSYAAITWIAGQAAQLGIDPSRIAVGGDSAGGNLAAVVALMARDQRGPQISLQLLIYPATDCTMSARSYVTQGDVLPLTTNAMRWFGEHYLGPAEPLRQDWRASPLRATSHANLPPAFILTAEHDVLCDEGQAYAVVLETAGVPVERAHYTGMIHGFITMGKIVRTANAAVDACAGALKRALL
jgi:acetyl esterase